MQCRTNWFHTNFLLIKYFGGFISTQRKFDFKSNIFDTHWIRFYNSVSESMSSIKVLVFCFFFLVSVLAREDDGLGCIGICVVFRKLLLVLWRTFAPLITPLIVDFVGLLGDLLGEEVVMGNDCWICMGVVTSKSSSSDSMNFETLLLRFRVP